MQSFPHPNNDSDIYLTQCSEYKGADWLIVCVFIFAYAKSKFSHDAAHMYNVKFGIV